MSNQKVEISGGGSLTLLFVILKLTGVVEWSWLWVLSPIWIGVILALVVFIIASLTNTELDL